MIVTREAAISKAMTLGVLEVAARIRPGPSDDLLRQLKGEDVSRYVKAYRVLNEVSVGEYLKVELEVEVDSGEIKRVLDNLIIDHEAVSKERLSREKPYIYIRILENPESNPIIKTLSKRGIEMEISDVLRGSGYEISGESSSTIKLETYLGIRAIENRASEISYNTAASVFVRAWDGEGKVITEVTDSSYRSGSSLENASLEALKTAASGAAKKLAAELDQRQNKKVKEETIEVLFRGLTNYIQYERIEQVLAKSIPGMDIKKRVLRGGGEVSFEVYSRMDSDELARTIQSLLPEDASFRLDQSVDAGLSFSAY